MNINARIIQFREAMHKNPTQFSADIGVPRTTLLGWEGGKSVPIETLEKIRKAFPNFNIEWFLTGEGEMLHGATFDDEAKKTTVSPLSGGESALSSVPRQREARDLVSLGLPLECQDGYELEGARLEGARSLEMSGPATGDDVVYVDFYAGQAAGAGPAQEVETYQPVTSQTILRRFINPWRPDQVKALEARGDSMTKIGLFDRDIVLFVPEETEGDGVFVISIENHMQVKRLEFDLLGRTLSIISENDRYAPRLLSDQADIERVKIEGKVVGWLHRHPY